MNYLTPSLLLPNELREALNTHEVLYFSGQPIQYVAAEDGVRDYRHVKHYDQCEAVTNLPLLVGGAAVRFSNQLPGPHRRVTLPGEFFAISGLHVDTRDEYWFGDRIDMAFSIHTDPVGGAGSCLWPDAS